VFDTMSSSAPVRSFSRARRRPVAIAAFGVVLLLSAAVVRADQQLLFDFERPGLGADWSAVRQITVARQPVPAFSQQAAVTPSGFGARISTQGGAGLFSKSGKVPEDWRRFAAVSFWVYRAPEEARRRPASSLEVQIFEKDGKARFWRRVDLDHTGWKEVSLPLRWFRFGDQRMARWDRVDRFGIWFRDAADVTVDAVSLTVGEAETASELTVADLVATAFPDRPAGVVRVRKNAGVRILTDAASLDVDLLVEYLSDLARAVRRDLPLSDRPASPATLIVFATREAYQAFPARLAQRMNGEGPVPQASGFTVHGISTSYWDERYGTFRPVYTHEFIHSLVAHGVLLGNRGEWFHEGLATHYQVQIHPQENFSQIVMQGLADTNQRLPLAQILSGRPIPQNRYWQAATVIDMLLTGEKYKSRVPALIAAFQQAGSTDIMPQLQPVLNVTAEQFDRDWQEHCRRKYGRQSE
jgi:hypothetical protein